LTIDPDPKEILILGRCKFGVFFEAEYKLHCHQSRVGNEINVQRCGVIGPRTRSIIVLGDVIVA
jgi:hypothetical protein